MKRYAIVTIDSHLFNFDLRYAFILHAFTIAIGHFNHANINIKYGFLKYILTIIA